MTNSDSFLSVPKIPHKQNQLSPQNQPQPQTKPSGSRHCFEGVNHHCIHHCPAHANLGVKIIHQKSVSESTQTRQKRECFHGSCQTIEVRAHIKLLGRVVCKKVKIMMVDIELLQPGICSTLKINYSFIVRSLWIYPHIPLHLVSSYSKGRKGNSTVFVSFWFTFHCSFIRPYNVIILTSTICMTRPSNSKKTSKQ